ncbi:HAD family hydrolase [Ureibacillus chungkukjangi]|uniref:Putative hydrolase of the HAD superfamily n=1 Tax=Ureibacillus chungkukjangi TaxID=1202712 RepID=A0A318U2A9_9BACL|nr:HAD family hydrolase [Ureibacillus chungkukjangi]PYF08525.1 putative hydrolase of the HAD superfamily [Ureibacillus chungkukjangi]
MIKALIFDFDGTIIDTETAWYITFRDAYKTHGVDLTLEQYSQCLGTSLHSFNPYTHLKTHHNLPIDLEEFKQLVQQQHTEMMIKERVRPGILQLLETAKSQGLKIGLASSSERSWIDKFVKLHGIENYFECYCTADTVKKVKPDPELYLQALEKLGVEASEAIAIEDSPNGARAAVAAGIPTVVIKNDITNQLPFSEGHHTIESLTNYDLEKLAELVQQKVHSS